MVKFEVTNTSNIRKYTYGNQVEPGETKTINILVKEAEEIPSSDFHVERVEEPESSQDEEVEADDEASLEKNPENEDSGGDN